MVIMQLSKNGRDETQMLCQLQDQAKVAIDAKAIVLRLIDASVFRCSTSSAPECMSQS